RWSTARAKSLASTLPSSDPHRDCALRSRTTRQNSSPPSSCGSAGSNAVTSASAGVICIKIEPGSPAERAGLRDGDIIVEFSGVAIERMDELYRLLTEDRVGK